MQVPGLFVKEWGPACCSVDWYLYSLTCTVLSYRNAWRIRWVPPLEESALIKWYILILKIVVDPVVFTATKFVTDSYVSERGWVNSPVVVFYMASCATPVIHVCCFRCITCVEIRSITSVADTCLIHMFCICNECVRYTSVLYMYFYTCNTCIGYTLVLHM